jgi:hypothetical protein
VPETLPRRRLLLSTAAALPLLLGTAGCRSQDLFAGPDPLAGPPPLSPSVVALEAVIAAERNLIGLYRSAMGSGPAGSRELAPLLSQHEQHLARLRARLIVPPGTRPAATAAATATTSPRSGTAVGSGRLRAAEQASAASLVRRLATVEPSLAQLFASVAASHATHASALSALGSRSG